MSQDLSQKKCVSCEGNVDKLEKTEIDKLLSQVEGWKHTVEEGTDKIYKEFQLDNFQKAIEFVNKLANLAEEEQHHPNILIHSWNQVKITFYTHSIGGLHENDFIMAKKVDDKIET